MTTQGALEPKEIEAWASQAEPGEQRPYAWGEPDIPRRAPGVATARELVARGKITCFARTISDGRREYIMRRVAERQRETFERFPTGPNTPGGVVLARLRADAEAGLPCSTNEQLEVELARHGFTQPTASYLVRCLAARYLIRVELFGPGRRRRVTIMATGARTKMERG